MAKAHLLMNLDLISAVKTRAYGCSSTSNRLNPLYFGMISAFLNDLAHPFN
jgi:hypothetical protein